MPHIRTNECGGHWMLRCNSVPHTDTYTKIRLNACLWHTRGRGNHHSVNKKKRCIIICPTKSHTKNQSVITFCVCFSFSHFVFSVHGKHWQSEACKTLSLIVCSIRVHNRFHCNNTLIHRPSGCGEYANSDGIISSYSVSGCLKRNSFRK